jgi:hypothetical protein
MFYTYASFLLMVLRKIRITCGLIAFPLEERETSMIYSITRIGISGGRDHLLLINLISVPAGTHG